MQIFLIMIWIIMSSNAEPGISSGFALLAKAKKSSTQKELQYNLESVTCDPSIYTMNYSDLTVWTAEFVSLFYFISIS